MEKLLDTLSSNVSKILTRGFRFCFPILRLFVSFCNAIIVLIGTVVFGAASVMYIIPRFHIFLSALTHIFNVYTVFWSAIVIGALTVCLGIAGIYFIWKGYYDKLGLQAASFLIVLIVLAAITFTFWTEWQENAHFGIAYATQAFNPSDKRDNYLKSIQESLSCCGSSGPRDFDIANEYFKYATAPSSCCNYQKYPKNCSEVSKTNDGHGGSFAISVEIAFESGCMSKMGSLVWPIIVYLILLESGLLFVCMLASSVMIIGHESYVKPNCSVLNDGSHCEHEEPFKLQ